MRHLITSMALVGLASTLALSGPAVADDDDDRKVFEVTVTNITRDQTFTPILVVTHESGVKLFTLGAPASDELATLAEDGDVGPLTALLEALPEISNVEDSGGLLFPGDSVIVEIEAQGDADHVSLAAMLIPTNDAFVSLVDVPLPDGKATSVLRAPAYDAGSEPNDELCINVPGPVCGGTGASPGVGGEDFVHIHAGIHGIGDLIAAERDWRNPVAEVVIRRIRRDDD